MFDGAYRLPPIKKVELYIKKIDRKSEIDGTRDESKPRFSCKHVAFMILFLNFQRYKLV